MTGEVGLVVACLMTGINLTEVVGIAFECHDGGTEDGLQALVEVEVLRGDGLLYLRMILAKQCLEGFVAQQDTIAVVVAAVMTGGDELVLKHLVEVHGVEHGERQQVDGEQVGIGGAVGLKDGDEVEPRLTVAGDLLNQCGVGLQDVSDIAGVEIVVREVLTDICLHLTARLVGQPVGYHGMDVLTGLGMTGHPSI